MKLLVTGGAGFIGSNYVRWVLAHTDDAVTVYDALTYAGNRSTLRDLADVRADRFRFVHGNICDLDRFSDGPRRSRRRGPLRGREPRRPVHRRPGGLRPHQLRRHQHRHACLPAGRHPGRPHLDRRGLRLGRAGYSRRERTSSTPARRTAPSKAGSDLIARAYYSTYGLPVMITRSSNNFGPYQYPEKVIPLFVTNLLDGLKVPLYGDGLNRRDWLYVDDNCAAIDAVLRPGTAGEIYNIGAGNELTNRDADRPPPATLAGAGPEMIEYVDRTAWATTGATPSTRPRSRALGWAPTSALDEALDATFSWYRDNRWWWEPLKAPSGVAA